jgi:nitrite reductase/ring-hydroxylating ferredoxin subunit
MMEPETLTQQDKVKRGSQDSWQYFRYMVDFVGFTAEDARAVKESGLIIEKHLPSIVGDFYTHLLRYPPTREHFIQKDGTVDQDYLQKRMLHLTNFWRRTAGGVFDEEYARYIDYVGRAHTSHGADPNIYIAERYVIGQVGFIQHAISSALHADLHEFNPDLEGRASRAWNLLLMVILEMLARAYYDEHEGEKPGKLLQINRDAMVELAVDAYERGLGLNRPPNYKEVFVAPAAEIPDGERKIIQVDDLSIGVFHHQGKWYAVRNHCLHRGGPVATGSLVGDVITCPWHGFQYNLTNGELLVDPATKLDSYRIIEKEDGIYLTIPEPEPGFEMGTLFTEEPAEEAVEERPTLKANQFFARDIPPGKTGLVSVNQQPVAVYNVEGMFYATGELCTHVGGPLDEGKLSGQVIVCPWHGSCFDVTTGEVKCGPATKAVETYPITVEGEIGSVG